MIAVNRGTGLFMLASVLAFGASWRPMRTEPRFLVTNDKPSEATPRFESRIAWRPEGVKEVHGSTLAALPGGELLMVYYGGSTESALDVKLYQTRFHDGKWQTPTVLMTPQQVGEATNRYTRRVGNSSLFRDAHDRLHLFFVSVGYFGWSCSSINQMTSTDEGKTWSPPKRLLTTPLLNLSTLVRSPAVPLENGGFLLPVYYELTNKFPEALEFNDQGELLRKVRMTGEHGSLQACIVPASDHEAHAYTRNRFHEDSRKLNYQKTSDGGRTWTPPQLLDVANLDSPVAALRLADDSYIMVYNPTFDREIIRLAHSQNGINWRDVKILDQMKLVKDQGMIEFSYPTFVKTGETIDLIYTYHRQGIRHYRFNIAWVKEQLRD